MKKMKSLNNGIVFAFLKSDTRSHDNFFLTILLYDCCIVVQYFIDFQSCHPLPIMSGILLMGPGIAFQKGKNDTIPRNKVEKIFTIHEENEKFKQILETLPEEHIEAAEEIISYAEGRLKCFEDLFKLFIFFMNGKNFFYLVSWNGIVFAFLKSDTRPHDNFFLTIQEIISYAEGRLSAPLSDHIHIALVDHLSFAIERVRKGFVIQNKLIYFE